MKTFRRAWQIGWAGMTLLLVAALAAWAQETVTRRARPPLWEGRVPAGVFFEDAFEEGLRGERPASLDAGRRTRGAASAPAATSPIGRAEVVDAKWSKRVSAATLEDEIKSIQRRIAEAIEDEADFQAQGHRQLRPHLATAAIVFAVINQFDGPVRWQADSATARDRFARAAQNARAGSVQVLRQVTERAQELDDLIRGGRLAGPVSNESWTWPDWANRQLLMQRLEIGMKTVLEPGVVSPASVQRHQAALMHESEMTAVLASVLKQAEMPDSTDDEYRAWCEQLERAALDLREAAEANDPAAARQAFGDVQSQCAACHEVYRG